MNIEELNGLEVRIFGYQTTYVLIQSPKGEVRINFIGKEEFKLSKETGGTFRLLEKSPLLVDYNEPMTEVFINSKPSDPNFLLARIKTIIDAKTEGSRNWLRYVTKNSTFRFENFQRNVREGNGFLLEAPISIAKEIELFCSEAGVQTKSFSSNREIVPRKIITIGGDFVIAKEFRTSL
jgi:hypothetical protein